MAIDVFSPPGGAWDLAAVPSGLGPSGSHHGPCTTGH